MPLFTTDEVKQAAASATGTILLEGFLGEQAIASRTDTFFEKQASDAQRAPAKHFDIFLSHVYADKVTVSGLYAILRASGFSVYVDWIHDRHRLNRANISAANAAILRERMHQCDSLLYATTPNHSTSKWMPWECGYFDGHDAKQIGESIRPGHVAILPVVQSVSSTFVGQEYLGLYPIAQNAKLPRRSLNIHNQQVSTRYLQFDKWIANGHP
jgi:hypothetical protein